MQKTICELFAGVGGFRLGFDRLNTGWATTWFSQWEPGAKTQWAHDCYVQHFGDSRDLRGEYHTGEDISIMDKKSIPDHTLLVGGFPCQDYSVAHTLASAKGIEGKKGVLWWAIEEMLAVKQPPFVLLENVDRLLLSPAKQRGRDFGIILRSFYENGYDVQWRVINAGEYGLPQKRRRTYIFAYHKSTNYYKKMQKIDDRDICFEKGIFAKQFPIKDGYDKRGWDMPMVLVEPGRYCVGNAGITLYTVGSYKYIKDIRDYITVDGGMTDNIRSCLYEAKYDAIIANKAQMPADHLVTVAGKNCESGDILIKDIMLQDPQPGDILAMFSTGAYHYSMSSNYNQLPKPAVVFTYQGKDRLVIRRQTFDDLVTYDVDSSYE